MSRAAGSTQGRWIAAQAALIVLAAAWIYGPGLRGTWLWDDGLEIYQNAAVRSAAGWRTPWYAPVGMDYLPLKSSLQWLEWRLWGDHVLGYHLANVALHVLGAFLSGGCSPSWGCAWRGSAGFFSRCIRSRSSPWRGSRSSRTCCRFRRSFAP